VRVDPLFGVNETSRTSGACVTFEPGARSAWHTHPAGQVLIVTAGIGRVQRWGGAVEEIRPGDVVWIPPGQKHWHGASPDTAMTHIAVQEHRDDKAVDWLEKVTDVQYGTDAPSAPSTSATDGNVRPAAVQQVFGDIAPKPTELTDDLLFGVVWAHPALSQRGRSLVAR